MGGTTKTCFYLKVVLIFGHSLNNFAFLWKSSKSDEVLGEALRIKGTNNFGDSRLFGVGFELHNSRYLTK